MQVWTLKKNLRSFIDRQKAEGRQVGFVPTMGALHPGHLSLVRKALDQNDTVVVSIFVNPTQFDRPSDLASYPRPLDRDLALLEELDRDLVVYLPVARDLYGGPVRARHYDLDGLDRVMEGRFRPGHFDGVATVVHLLFDAVQPDKAYFGEKDFQQLQIIRTLARKLNLPLRIVPVEIFREPDGLAMSSRNALLTPEHRQAAPLIYRTLQEAERMKREGKNPDQIKQMVKETFDRHPLLQLEYFQIADEERLQPARQFRPGIPYRAFIAVFAGDVRLIDNIALP